MEELTDQKLLARFAADTTFPARRFAVPKLTDPCFSPNMPPKMRTSSSA